MRRPEPERPGAARWPAPPARRGRPRHPRGRELVLPLRHRELAALVVSTRETVSLELQRLERDHLIARLGRQIVVSDLRQLRAAARDAPERLAAARSAPGSCPPSTRGARAS
ncbi:helix-turn-helix domain-containing protein [Nannocystis pusilla]|uniref:helix-turn-helix domain-containing protein n=1 Tax=Nannocystis pusilla TaxID=889268 RepID=UPI003B770274